MKHTLSKLQGPQSLVYLGTLPPFAAELLCKGEEIGSYGPLTIAPTCINVPDLQNAALRGSAEAAEKLALLYQDEPEEKHRPNYAFWSLIAAENGSSTAMFQMGMLYTSSERDGSAVLRGRFWLERAASMGEPSAKSILRGTKN